MSERRQPAVVSLGGGRYLLEDDRRRQVAWAVRGARETWVFLDGRTYLVRAERASRAAGRGHDDAALAAPMPATVVAVSVGAGQQVAAGELLITLEAMKMELAIRAPRDAVVREVRCRPGELVQPGVPLLELE